MSKILVTLAAWAACMGVGSVSGESWVAVALWIAFAAGSLRDPVLDLIEGRAT